MKKQALAIAIASALAAPSAFAAQDTSGMHYTSASEGFYASLRAQLDFSNSGNDANIYEGSSRFGIRGTNDLGGGLEGFYTWETQANFDNVAVGNTRLGHVGLRGNFGQIQVGRFWSNDYSWTHGSTDIANWDSGSLSYDAQRYARVGQAIEYTTPDLNGFQGALYGVMNGGTDGNDLDQWNLAAKYEVQGFTVGASYNSQRKLDPTDTDDVEVEGFAVTGGPGEKDLTSWTVRLGYTQDNWYVTGWYGEDSLSEFNGMYVVGGSGSATAVSFDDTELFSLAGGISVDKVNLYARYEQETLGARGGSTNISIEDTYGTVGAQYNLGAQSRVWIEYVSRDLDSDSTTEDYVNVGLRHDF